MVAPALSMLPALPVDWCARLRSRLHSAPDHRLEHSRTGTQPALLREGLPERLAAAAVLVPIVLHPNAPALLLTVRASHLRSHAGQISFPGGRVEPTDLDLAAAALRETQEEIGIHAASIEPVGFLSDQLVRSGYRITPVGALLQPDLTPTPVVALLHPNSPLRPDISEVAELFELPLAVTLSAGNYRSRPGRALGLEF